MGLAFLGLAIFFMFAFLYVFTGLNKNASVQSYETSFSLFKLCKFGLKVDKGKVTKASDFDDLKSPK